jgi:hypothetical protein
VISSAFLATHSIVKGISVQMTKLF